LNSILIEKLTSLVRLYITRHNPTYTPPPAILVYLDRRGKTMLEKLWG
jgi:hypothetical protein